jgi:CRISPR-associated protein Cas2
VRILVTYDVNTTTPQGERRLRRVARVCLNYGQRVQQSVFECVVSETQYEEMRRALLSEIDEQVDSLRLYRLTEVLGGLREVFGQFRDIDFTGPLVV